MYLASLLYYFSSETYPNLSLSKEIHIEHLEEEVDHCVPKYTFLVDGLDHHCPSAAVVVDDKNSNTHHTVCRHQVDHLPWNHHT